VGCGEAESVAIPAEDISKLGIADAHGLLQHSLEHWLKIARRAIDDLKNLGRSRRLLQRFRKVSGALTQFIEQPRTLDGYHGLSGKVLHKRDLFIAEWPDFLA